MWNASKGGEDLVSVCRSFVVALTERRNKGRPRTASGSVLGRTLHQLGLKWESANGREERKCLIVGRGDCPTHAELGEMLNCNVVCGIKCKFNNGFLLSSCELQNVVEL